MGIRGKPGTCFGGKPREGVYTSFEVVQAMQAGGRVPLGVARLRADGMQYKQLTFAEPYVIELSDMQLTPFDTCVDYLARQQANGLDLASLYVVQAVLSAEVKEQLCREIEADVSVMGAGASAGLSEQCVQGSEGHVAVAFKTRTLPALLQATGHGDLVAAAGTPPPAPAPAPAKVTTAPTPRPAPAPQPSRKAERRKDKAERVAAAEAAPKRQPAPEPAPSRQTSSKADLAAVRAKRLESIGRLKELLGRGDVQGEAKAEMMNRLAVLYAEEGDQLTAEGATADARSWTEQAVQLHQMVLQSYPRYARADEVTWWLGHNLAAIGRADEGVTQHKNLVKLYPESAYVPDAYVAIGEFYFDSDNVYGALRAYLKATSYRDHPKYAFAMYKLGWCYFNVGEYGKAIETMKAVVAFGMAGGSKEDFLVEEALKDLVRFFADAGEMDEAYTYFAKLGRKDLIRSMLARLGTMYFEQGKYEQSVQVHRRLILEDPQSPRAVVFQGGIVTAYRKMGDAAGLANELGRLEKTYGPDSAWRRANAGDRDAIAEADRIIAEARSAR